MEVGENVDLNKEINLIQGDCLGKMKEIPDKSIDLVLIDPPYNINKADWDKWKTVDAYVEFMGQVFLECQRVLKDNGSFYFFHNDFLQIVELQNYINKNTDFIFNSFIIWDKGDIRALSWKNPSEKNNLRSWFNTCEYCLFYTFQNEAGLETINKNISNYLSIKKYLNSLLEQKNMKYNDKQLVDLFVTNGIAKNEASAKTILKHKLDINYKQFQFITERQYNILNKVLDFDRTYEDLKQEYEELRQEYEKQRYTHNLDKNHKNIWVSNERNNGKLHSCQKPLDILERIIKTSSNENDTVLDCFMGSGSTGVACINANRKFIGIEKDGKYFEIACNRIKEVKK